MALKEIRQAIFILTAQVIIYSIATTLAFFMFLRTVLLWFRSPSGIFFSKRRELPPDLLNDQSLGEHHYIQIKVSFLLFTIVARYWKRRCINL